MGAVATVATLHALAMRGLSFRGMATAATCFRRRSAVRLVTAQAILVPCRRRLVFLGVAVLAADSNRAAVRLMAARALRVAVAHFGVLARVARGATLGECLRAMR